MSDRIFVRDFSSPRDGSLVQDDSVFLLAKGNPRRQTSTRRIKIQLRWMVVWFRATCVPFQSYDSQAMFIVNVKIHSLVTNFEIVDVFEDVLYVSPVNEPAVGGRVVRKCGQTIE